MDGVSETELRNLTVSSAQHGDRIDRALAQAAAEFSRSYLQQLIEEGAVALNGQTVAKSSQRVKAGDLIAVELRPTQQSQAFKAQPMDLDVVYEDEHVLVINKPAGLVVHPAPGNWSGTLLNGLLARDPLFASVPRAGIVHRLDKDTSGLMVVARTRLAMDALVKAIAAREVSRQYLALAHNPWKGATQVSVDKPIGRDPRNRLRMAVVDLSVSSGKQARTDVFWQANSVTGCWVRCALHTGRTHQIRVHMASLGHPLVGDALYGGSPESGMSRQALHAFRLAFHHPITGVWNEFLAQPATDFLALLALWGLSYNVPTGPGGR
ncbi:MAG: RluA family pseudouridine synthase [Rhodoferax sp.]|nr:RluA family pseudouridine synthase [Rhodoferax sp.]MDZ7919248.1 RluA family pseudouridine synthase [Rhodoferax sp.]